MRRTGVCGATETILVDRAYPAPLAIIDALVAAGCEVRGDKAIMVLSPHVETASTADWDSEYLDAIVSIAMADGTPEARAAALSQTHAADEDGEAAYIETNL